ncbi:MAG: hypothetical protein BWK80_58875 [Desulfobacteraceae bacterium IS3]|nr:MAG: hypothetical protein BWK80_58875 [Desulfobacteraceae bacterium IS3]
MPPAYPRGCLKSIFSPAWTTENSPAIYCRAEKKDQSPGNLSPAMNCRAIFGSPYGTKNDRLLLFKHPLMKFPVFSRESSESERGSSPA